MDKLKFKASAEKALKESKKNSSIGVLSEKSLHAALKNYYEPFDERQEIKIGGFVADIAGENGIIEIQTGQFHRLRKKLSAFLECSDVTVVYPIAQTKYISWLDPKSGEITDKRKSPKKGKIYDCFKELYKIKPFLSHPRFHFIICILEVEQIKILDGYSKDRKKGATKAEIIPLELINEIAINSLEDYQMFIPKGLEEKFTSAQFARACKINTTLAQTALNVLTDTKTVIRVGKDGKRIIYSENTNNFSS